MKGNTSECLGLKKKKKKKKVEVNTYGVFGGDLGHEGGLCDGGSGGEQGRLGDNGGAAISAHLLPQGETGGMGLHGFRGGGDGGGSGPRILLLNSSDLSAGNFLIAALSCKSAM